MTNPALTLWHEAIAEALRRLSAPAPSATRVHSARKALKRARAALRLLRLQLGADAYTAANLALRDAGRCLSPLRDARVSIRALASFSGSAGKRLAAEIADLRRDLRQRLARLRREHVSTAMRARCVALVRTGQAQVGLRREDGERVRRDLRRIYATARRAFVRAAKRPSPARLHEWRKQTQYLNITAKALRRAGLQHLRKLSDQSGRVADYLGDDHDLYALRAAASRHGALRARIDRRRGALQRKALAAGAKAFAERPRSRLAALS